jgi:curved DNA-binding protein CbpA
MALQVSSQEEPCKNIMRNLYDILGISSDVSQDEIKRKYRELAKKYHPDVNADTKEEFLLIAYAYNVLSDPSSREKYDEGALPLGDVGVYDEAVQTVVFNYINGRFHLIKNLDTLLSALKADYIQRQAELGLKKTILNNELARLEGIIGEAEDCDKKIIIAALQQKRETFIDDIIQVNFAMRLCEAILRMVEKNA